MDTGAECLQTPSATIEETKEASNGNLLFSPNNNLASLTSNPASKPASSLSAAELSDLIPVPYRPLLNSTKRKTPSIERFLSSRRECFWPVEISTIGNGSSTLGLGIITRLSSALNRTWAYLSRSIAEYILAVVHKIGKWPLKMKNAVPFGFVAWGRLIPQIAKTKSSTESIAAPVPADVIKAISMPLFPIRVFYGKPPPFSPESQKRTMRWRYRCRFGIAPEIIQEPNTQHIRETVQQYIDFIAPETETISVEFLAQGAFNQAYNIIAENKATAFRKEYVFRVALPIYPHYKLESDVATTEFVRHTTRIPVPIIYAFDSSPNNKLGFEWMLMEKVTGISLYDAWDTMEYNVKQELTKTVANWVDQISRLKFDTIGSLYCRQRADQMEFYMGPCLHARLFEGDRLLYDIPRGPFESIRSFLDAVLESTERHVNDPRHKARHKLEAVMYDEASWMSDDESSGCSEQKDQMSEEEILAQADEKDRRNERWFGVSEDDLEWMPDELRLYRVILPKLCPLLPSSESTTTMLTHPDLTASNVLVDESGAPVALIDWERARIEPIAFANPVPHFLTEDSASDPDYFYIPSGCTISTGRKENNVYFYAAEDLAQIRGQNERSYTQVMENIQLTHLRALYRQELKSLHSPIQKAFEKDAESLEQQLIERVLWPERAPPYSALDWAIECLGESVVAELDGEDDGEDQQESVKDETIHNVGNGFTH